MKHSKKSQKPVASPRVWSNIKPAEKPVPAQPKRKSKKIWRLIKKAMLYFWVVITVFLGYIKKYSNSKKLKSKRNKRNILVAIGVVILIIIGGLIYNQIKSSDKVSVESQPPKNTQPELKAPNYPTVLPAGKTIQSLGGWTRVSPPDRNPVFAYVDHIGKTKIIVSQQPLPKDLEHSTAQKVKQLAVGYKATDKITTGKSVAYVGTSVNGPQSVITNKGELLILIKSSVKIKDKAWANYINSLH